LEPHGAFSGGSAVVHAVYTALGWLVDVLSKWIA
jgi:hypothetical protein